MNLPNVWHALLDRQWRLLEQREVLNLGIRVLDPARQLRLAADEGLDYDAGVWQGLPHANESADGPLGFVEEIVQLPIQPERPRQRLGEVRKLALEIPDQLLVRILLKVSGLHASSGVIRK